MSSPYSAQRADIPLPFPGGPYPPINTPPGWSPYVPPSFQDPRTTANSGVTAYNNATNAPGQVQGMLQQGLGNVGTAVKQALPYIGAAGGAGLLAMLMSGKGSSGGASNGSTSDDSDS